MSLSIGDFVNSIADPADAKAVQGIVENFGDVCPADIIRQSSLDRDYTYEEFETNPVSAGIAGGAATGTAGDENVIILEDNIFEYHMMGTQTILAPSLVATGLLVSLDLTDNDGAEYTQGITAKSRSAFVVGTSPPFFLRVKFSIADVSGTDDCAVGFRLAEAYQANIDDYDTFACLNIIGGAIKTETDIDGAGTTTTDTTDTWGDGETHTLEVYVSAIGAVTYKVDGVAPTTTVAMTITDGDTVVPFFYFLHATTSPGNIILQSWECGPQSAMV